MFNKVRFRFTILLLILLTLLISGCWDQVEIKERTIVIGIGIDKNPGNEPILLTAQVINLSTSKGNGGGAGGSSGMGTEKKGSPENKPITVETSTGKSFYDAIHNFLKYSSRRVIFSHNRIVILGKELAQTDITGIFDYMARDFQFRRTNWLLVAENTAQEILESRTDLGMFPAKEMNQMMINLTKDALILPVTINDFMVRLDSEEKASLAPLVAIEKSGSNPSERIRIEKTAVFKNNRLVDVLTAEESQGLLWFADKQKGGSLVFPFKTRTGQKMISVAISKGTSRIHPRITKEGILVEIDCTGEGVLRETEDIDNTPQTIERLDHEVEKILKQRVERTIKKAQQIKTDFLGFASLIHGEEPEQWRRIKQNWEEEFPRIRSQVRFQININSFGLVKDSIIKSNRQE